MDHRGASAGSTKEKSASSSWPAWRTAATALLIAALWCGLGSPARAEARQDYCAYGDGTVLMFIDRTTDYDKRDLEILTSGLDSIFAELRPGERFVLHTITGDYTKSERMFDRCVPGCPDTGLLEWMVGTCKPVIARADNRQFRVDLAATLRNMLANVEQSDHSAIVSTIAEVSHAYAGKKLRHVIVYSDLLENSKFLPWSRFRSLDPTRAMAIVRQDGIKADLRGASVRVFGFGRIHDPGRAGLPPDVERRIAKFWTLFFDDAGASSVDIGLWYAGSRG